MKKLLNPADITGSKDTKIPTFPRNGDEDFSNTQKYNQQKEINEDEASMSTLLKNLQALN